MGFWIYSFVNTYFILITYCLLAVDLLRGFFVLDYKCVMFFKIDAYTVLSCLVDAYV